MLEFVINNGRPSTSFPAFSASSDSAPQTQRGEHVADLHDYTFAAAKVGRLRYIKPSCKAHLHVFVSPFSFSSFCSSSSSSSSSSASTSSSPVSYYRRADLIDFAVVDKNWLCLALWDFSFFVDKIGLKDQIITLLLFMQANYRNTSTRKCGSLRDLCNYILMSVEFRLGKATNFLFSMPGFVSINFKRYRNWLPIILMLFNFPTSFLFKR